MIPLPGISQWKRTSEVSESFPQMFGWFTKQL